MKSKNKLLIAGTVFLSLCSITFFVVITYAFFNPENFKLHLMTIFEKEAYILCGLSYLSFYSVFIKKANSNKSKILLGAGTAATCTVQIILINNLWHYIEFNEHFDWIGPARYLSFLVQDIFYIQNGNGFKYLVVFLWMFSACLFDAFLLRKTINLYKGAFFGDIIIISKED